MNFEMLTVDYKKLNKDEKFQSKEEVND